MCQIPFMNLRGERQLDNPDKTHADSGRTYEIPNELKLRIKLERLEQACGHWTAHFQKGFKIIKSPTSSLSAM